MNDRPETFPVEHSTANPDAETVVFIHGGNVANWMWQPQVAGFADYHVLTPNLPGFGARAGEDWVSLEAAADDVAELIAASARQGRAHIVGLSLGGVVASRIAARHPQRVRSVLATGAPLDGVAGLTRTLGGLQLAFWDKPGFWGGQARAFGLPEDSRQLYVDSGLLIRKPTAERMLNDVYNGGYPDGLENYLGPYLALAGERESSIVRKSFPALREPLPQLVTREVPGMHHIWSVEDVDLFNRVTRQWIESGTPATDLLAVR